MIRPAVPNDIDAIVLLWEQMSIMHEIFDSAFALKRAAAEQYKPYAESVIADSNKLMLVYQNDIIDGYLNAEVTNQPPVFAEEKVGVINELSIDEKCRRKGIGEALVNKAEEWFHQRGIKSIRCQVATKNPLSTNFWAKIGYQEYIKICMKKIN